MSSVQCPVKCPVKCPVNGRESETNEREEDMRVSYFCVSSLSLAAKKGGNLSSDLAGEASCHLMDAAYKMERVADKL